MVGAQTLEAVETTPPIAPLAAGTKQQIQQMVVKRNDSRHINENRVDTILVNPVVST